MWSHYAERHQGVCLGFDVPDGSAAAITYTRSRLVWPEIVGDDFVQQLLFTKFSHWSYEREFRMYVALNTEEAGVYYFPFSHELSVAEVIVGCRSAVTREDVRGMVSGLLPAASCFKARESFRKFGIVRQQNAELWL